MVTADGTDAFVLGKRKHDRRHGRGRESTRQWQRMHIRRMSHCLVISGQIPERPCLVCGSQQSLRIHHIEPLRPGRFVFLCGECHIRAHRPLYRQISINRPFGQFSVRPEAAVMRKGRV